MKIVHTEASLGLSFGGQELRILNEARGLQQRGHELTLICSEKSPLHSLASQHGLSVVALPISKKKWAGLVALRRYLISHQPDVINTHSSTDSWLVALATQFMKNRPAIVRTRHVSVPVSKSMTSRWLYTRSCDHIVTTGETLRQTLINDNGYDAARITSVPTGIDLARFKPTHKNAARDVLGLNQQDLIIGIVAALRRGKGHHYLIEAFARLSKNPALKLLIVGDGQQENALKEQVAALKLEKQVLFNGWQSNVETWLQAMDIFCLPSFFAEGVPQSLMQAQACGLPVITTLAGSINEAIIPEKSALIVLPEDVDSLENALATLINDEAMRLEMGKVAVELAISRFSEAQMLNKMEAIFTQVTQR